MRNTDFVQLAKKVGGVLLVVVGIFLIFSSAKNTPMQRCTGLKIHITNGLDNALIIPADVEKWATQHNAEPLVGKAIAEIDLSSLEKRLENNGYISDCQAYVDLNGFLHLKVKTYLPVARILSSGEMPDRYMDKDGHFFPVSQNSIPTLLLVSGTYFQNRKGLESSLNRDLLDLVNTITKDNFWNAQITRIDVNRNKEIIMEPLLGNHIIEFGKPIKAEEKLNKLMVFYNKILPQDKWSNFSQISVKYDGQIVCN